MAESEVCIIGGGIVGCATAHYLRKIAGPEMRITVVDKVGIAAAASGRAGGFLARDWHRGPTAALAAHSFALHSELAAEFGAEAIGFRPCRAAQPTCKGGETAKTGPSWFDGCAGNAPEIAARDEAAQVIPQRLVEALFAASGAELLVGTPTALRAGSAPGKRVLTVVAEGGKEAERELDALLLCAGPWTSSVAQTLGVPMRASVGGLKAHSILLRPTAGKVEVDDSCLFVNWQGDPFAGEFELYARLDGVYVCGCGEETRAVTEGPADVAISDRARACLTASAASVSSALGGAEVLRATACYLPVASTGTIVAGELQPGVFVATGHTCWGILNGPATGQGMAQMMLGRGGDAAAKLLAPFAPRG